MNTITLSLATIPSWLSETPLAESLRDNQLDMDVENTDDTFEVPTQYIMTNDELTAHSDNSTEHVRRILQVLHYWGEQTNVPWAVLDVVKCVHAQNVPDWAAIETHFDDMAVVIEIIRTISSRGIHIMSAYVFAKLGFISGLKYLLERGCLWNTEEYWSRVTPTNKFEDYCKIISVPDIGEISDIYVYEFSGVCMAAAYYGQLDCLRYSHENGCPLDDYVCTYAAMNGQCECLRYAHEHGGSWDEETCNWAVHKGSLECLQYAHEHGCPWDEETCNWAAHMGHLECLRYAHDHGCPWDERTCEQATENGQYECLQYAHENGCLWDERTCKAAAEAGSLECLQYAHEYGCPWDDTTCAMAFLTGHIECLRYAHTHGCPSNIQFGLKCYGVEYLYHSYRQLDCIKYAIEHKLVHTG